MNRWEIKQIGSSLWSCIINFLSHRLSPATDPADQQRVVNSKLDHRVQLLLSLVQQAVQLEEKDGGSQTQDVIKSSTVVALSFHLNL